MTRFGSAPEDSGSDQTWLDGIGAATLRLAVQAEPRVAPEGPVKPPSGDDEFLLRRLLAGEDPDPVVRTDSSAKPAELADVDIDQRRVLGVSEFGARFRIWADEGPRPAALDVTVDGLLAVQHAMGLDVSHYVGRVLLHRMVEASHPSAVACRLSDNRVLLAQPTREPWVFRVIQAVENPILVSGGRVRVRAERPDSREDADGS